MTDKTKWEPEKLEKQIELELSARNRAIARVQQSTYPGHKEDVEKHNKAHLSDDEYRDYIREIIIQEFPPP